MGRIRVDMINARVRKSFERWGGGDGGLSARDNKSRRGKGAQKNEIMVE